MLTSSIKSNSNKRIDNMSWLSDRSPVVAEIPI